MVASSRLQNQACGEEKKNICQPSSFLAEIEALDKGR